MLRIFLSGFDDAQDVFVNRICRPLQSDRGINSMAYQAACFYSMKFKWKLGGYEYDGRRHIEGTLLLPTNAINLIDSQLFTQGMSKSFMSKEIVMSNISKLLRKYLSAL